MFTSSNSLRMMPIMKGMSESVSMGWHCVQSEEAERWTLLLTRIHFCCFSFSLLSQAMGWCCPYVELVIITQLNLETSSQTCPELGFCGDPELCITDYSDEALQLHLFSTWHPHTSPQGNLWCPLVHFYLLLGKAFSPSPNVSTEFNSPALVKV